MVNQLKNIFKYLFKNINKFLNRLTSYKYHKGQTHIYKKLW